MTALHFFPSYQAGAPAANPQSDLWLCCSIVLFQSHRAGLFLMRRLNRALLPVAMGIALVHD
jgi:hypothetical protein